jgi:hypothetical protein
VPGCGRALQGAAAEVTEACQLTIDRGGQPLGASGSGSAWVSIQTFQEQSLGETPHQQIVSARSCSVLSQRETDVARQPCANARSPAHYQNDSYALESMRGE